MSNPNNSNSSYVFVKYEKNGKEVKEKILRENAISYIDGLLKMPGVHKVSIIEEEKINEGKGTKQFLFD